MKYLIRDKKRAAIAAGAVLATAVNLVRAFKSGGGIEEAAIAFFLAVFTLLGLYFNIPTSSENAEATAEMEQRKRENKAGYLGEKFYDCIEDEDDYFFDEDIEEGEEEEYV